VTWADPISGTGHDDAPRAIGNCWRRFRSAIQNLGICLSSPAAHVQRSPVPKGPSAALGRWEVSFMPTSAVSADLELWSFSLGVVLTDLRTSVVPAPAGYSRLSEALHDLADPTLLRQIF